MKQNTNFRLACFTFLLLFGGFFIMLNVEILTYDYTFGKITSSSSNLEFKSIGDNIIGFNYIYEVKNKKFNGTDIFSIRSTAGDDISSKRTKYNLMNSFYLDKGSNVIVKYHEKIHSRSFVEVEIISKFFIFVLTGIITTFCLYGLYRPRNLRIKLKKLFNFPENEIN